MSARPNWAEVALGRMIVMLNGVAKPSRANLNFIGSGWSINDNSGNDSTDVSRTDDAPITHFIDTSVDGATYTIAETSGEVVLVVTNLTEALTIKAPLSTDITEPLKITIKARTTLFSDALSITFDGNGKDVEFQAELTTTFEMTPDNVGPGGSVTWFHDGTEYIEI